MPFTIPNLADAAATAQAAPDAVDFSVITAGAALTGVVSGCAATVTGTNMVVSIAAGQVVVAGKDVTVAAGSATISAANATNPRFDLVVVNNAGTISAVTGTAGSNPVFPAIPANSAVLYAVYVPANDTAIASNQLTDKRVTIVRDDSFLSYSFF